GPAPGAADAPDERLRVVGAPRLKVDDRAEARRVLKADLPQSFFRFGTQQPRGCNEAFRLEAGLAELILRLRDQLCGLLAVDVVKLTFPRGIEAGRELLLKCLVCSMVTLVRVAVDHELVSVVHLFREPAAEVLV